MGETTAVDKNKKAIEGYKKIYSELIGINNGVLVSSGNRKILGTVTEVNDSQITVIDQQGITHPITISRASEKLSLVKRMTQPEYKTDEKEDEFINRIMPR